MNGMARLKTPSIARIGPKSNSLTASRSDIAIINQGDLAPAGTDSADRQSTHFAPRCLRDDEYPRAISSCC
jgi:hypothetical protein